MEPMRVPTRGIRLRSRATLAALVCAIALLPGPSYASPGEPDTQDDTSIEDIHDELTGLYRDAEVATEAYNTADGKADDQQKVLASLRGDLSRTKDRLADLHDLAGAAARTQYRRGDLEATGIQLLLGDHPEHALDDAAQARQAMRNLSNVSRAVERNQSKLTQQTASAKKKLRQLEKSREDKADAKQRIEKKIAEAERIEAGLKKEQARELAQLEQQEAQEAKAKWKGSDSGTSTGSGGGSTKATGAAAKAVDFAMAQIGKPYVWGAVGPSSYDCSGLTSTAWAAAGHPIPRTAQAQWQGLTRVSLASVRPGDLIIYYDATHVGMYIGDGQIVHAPRPGRNVTIAPAASMPILGVVRPGV